MRLAADNSKPIDNTRADRIILTILLVLTAAASLSGLAIAWYHDMTRIDVPNTISFNPQQMFSPVLLIDLVSALALGIGALALWFPRVAKVANVLLAAWYLFMCALFLPALRQFEGKFEWAPIGMLISVGIALLAAHILLRKKAIRFVPLVSLIFILACYAGWHSWHWLGGAMMSYTDEWYLGNLLTANFQGAQWWHILVFLFFGLSSIWTIRFIWHSNASLEGNSPPPSPRGPRRRAYVVASIAWILMGAFTIQNYSLTGLAPFPYPISPHPSFEERLLYRVPAWCWYATPRVDGSQWDDLRKMIEFSPIGDKVAYLETDRNLGVRVVNGGVPGPWYDAIEKMRFAWPGGKLSYVAKRGDAWHVVFDGREGPALDDPPSPYLGKDGNTPIYNGSRSGKFFAVFGDIIRPISQYASPVNQLPDGDLVYEIGQSWLMVGDRVLFKAPPGAKLVHSRDLRQIGYIIERPRQKASSADGATAKWDPVTTDQILFMNGREGPAFDQIEGGWPAFSPDGVTTAYLGIRRGRKFLVVNGEIQPLRPRSPPTFTSDGRLAYVATEGNGDFVMLAGQRGPVFEKVVGPVFSPDGAHYAYAAWEGGKQFMIIDGRKGPQLFAENVNWVFDPSWKTFAYPLRDGAKECIVVGEKKGPWYNWVSIPVFSPDGRTVAYKAFQSYKKFIVANDREGPRFTWVSDPVFSPDGNRIAYAAEDGREFWWKVMAVR